MTARATSGDRSRATAIAWIVSGGVMIGGCFGPRTYPGPAVCVSVADCDDGTPCTIDWCDDGACKHDAAAGATPDDANACTTDKCVKGGEVHTAANEGSQCGNYVLVTCDAAGTCQGCDVDSQCGDDQPCFTYQCNVGKCEVVLSPAGTVCLNEGRCDGHGRCATCSDKMQDGLETDVDCGGGCDAKCAAGKHCDTNDDCSAAATCVEGVCTNSGAGGTAG